MAIKYLDRLYRLLPFTLLMVYIAQLAAFVISVGGMEQFVRLTDFMPTLTAAQVIVEGNGLSLYDVRVQQEVQRQLLFPYKTLGAEELLPYMHLPFEAVLIAPLMPLSYVGVTLLWTLLLAVVLAATLFLLQRTLPIKRPWLLILLLCILSYQPVFRAFLLGQNSPLLLCGICITFAALRHEGRQWDLWAGVGLLLAALKPQICPLLFLLVLLAGRWKAVWWFGLLMALLSIALMPLLGIAWPLHYSRLLLGAAAWGDSAGIYPVIMHNWRGFAANLAGAASPLAMPITVAMSLLSVLLFLVAWWVARRRNHRTAATAPALWAAGQGAYAWNLLWALGVVTAILISPHLNPHDLMLLIFPAWIVVHAIQESLLPAKLAMIWMHLLRVLYLIMPIALFTRSDLPVWVILNVSLLGVSCLLLLISLTSLHQDARVRLRSGGFDMVAAKD